MAEGSSRTVVVAALVANALVTLTKFGAGLFTGSSAMLSEAVHSLVDTGNEALLLYGQHRASLPPDEDHPLGHGRELYFWSLVVALSLFAVGSGLSFYEGVSAIIHPEPIKHPYINYGVLGAAFLFDGYSWQVAVRSFRRKKGSLGWVGAVRKSKDPPGFIVMFEDSADLIGLVLAFLGNAASITFNMPYMDGVASIGIAILLGSVAAILSHESKGLLIGEGMAPQTVAEILSQARRTSGIRSARNIFTVHLAPDQAIVALAVDFEDAMSVVQVKQVVGDLTSEIQRTFPEVREVLVTPGHGTYRSRTGREPCPTDGDR